MSATITADQSGLDDPGRWAPSGDRYELRDELARGGGGRIVIARDRKLDRIVAVKLPLESTGSALSLSPASSARTSSVVRSSLGSRRRSSQSWSK